MTSFESAMLKPGHHFRTPRDVLAEPWTTDEKFQVLRQWKYDIGQLHVATEENMAPPRPVPDPVSLEQIHQAMEELGLDPEADPVPTKGA